MEYMRNNKMESFCEENGQNFATAGLTRNFERPEMLDSYQFPVSVLTSSDLNMHKWGTSELENLIMSSDLLQMPTPSPMFDSHRIWVIKSLISVCDCSHFKCLKYFFHIDRFTFNTHLQGVTIEHEEYELTFGNALNGVKNIDEPYQLETQQRENVSGNAIAGTGGAIGISDESMTYTNLGKNQKNTCFQQKNHSSNQTIFLICTESPNFLHRFQQRNQNSFFLLQSLNNS